MAKDNAFSLSALLEMFWDMAKGYIANIPNTIMSSINGLFGGWLEPIMKKFGFDEKVAELTEKVGDLGNQLTSSFDKDLSTARTETAKAAEQFITKHKANLLVDDAHIKSVQDLVQQSVTNFLATGIPKPDGNHVPVAAYTAALELRSALVLQLAGNNSSSLGLLPSKLANRAEEAERIATLITGIPADSDLTSIAANPPKTGLAAVLATTQATRHAEGFKEGGLQGLNFTIQADGASLLPIGSQENKNITGGTDTKETTTPTGGKTKDNSVAK